MNTFYWLPQTAAAFSLGESGVFWSVLWIFISLLDDKLALWIFRWPTGRRVEHLGLNHETKLSLIFTFILLFS